MNDTVSGKKNKIFLADYDYKSDLEHRLLMSQFTTLDLLILEGILYSSLKISVGKLAKTLEVEEAQILPILEKFSKGNLLTFKEGEISVDKEMRKYYEAEMVKFDEEFTPGMEFLQSLLKKVPIQVLPTWYSIPRSSNNIFDSLVEKYLLTPQIFHRYLSDLQQTDPVISGMIETVYTSPDFKAFGTDLIEKHHLSREKFEELMLYLEFHFVCCLSYEKVGDEWKEIVTPFQEWRDYLRFLAHTEVTPIPNPEKVAQKQASGFSFIEQMASLLSLLKKTPLPCTDSGLLSSEQMDTLAKQDNKIQKSEIPQLISKLCLLKMAGVVDHQLYALEGASDWLAMNLEHRALFIHRHPLNRLSVEVIPSELCTEKNIREVEKSLSRALNKGWVYFDDFFKGLTVPLGEQPTIMLKKQGKSWKYVLPEYTEEERLFIQETIFSWLPEVGMISTGVHQGRNCFYVTPFGESIFQTR